MNAILTGSYRYGVPHVDSDIDLCILCEDWVFDELRRLSDPLVNGSAGHSIRFGRLNIIALTDPVEFAAWQLASHKLDEVGPTTRVTAVEFIKSIRDGMPKLSNGDKMLQENLCEETTTL